MKHNGKIALIPAYNPDEKLLGVVEDLKLYGFTVLIVDDGSGEEFQEIFRKAGELSGANAVVHLKSNKGKGTALKTGLKYIRDNCEAPYVVTTVDADGQHGISDINTVTRAAQSNRGTFIIGSRRLDRSTPFRSRSGNLITRVFLNTLTPARIYDTQSGLRSFSDDIVPILCKTEGSRYEYEMKVLIDVTRNNIPVKEIKIKAIYIDGNSSTHFRTIADSVRIYKTIFSNAGYGEGKNNE